MALALSVLDQSPIPQGTPPAEVVRNTVELARLAERLGYRRYWLAEQLGGAACSGARPRSSSPTSPPTPRRSASARAG